MDNQAVNNLREIGLNQLEAEVYHLLLTKEPMTAYRIGKLLNKPTANIYKAVDSLGQKGAVVFQQGKNKLCKAVDPGEFIELTRNRFNMKTDAAKKNLSNIKPVADGENTYILESVELIFEKAKRIIDNSENILVIDVFPTYLKKIERNIKAAVKRGVEIYLIVYDETKIEGVNTATCPTHLNVIEYWKSEQLNLVADGKELVIALVDLETNHIHHATWSTNIYSSYVLLSGLLREHTINRIMNVKNTSHKLEEIEKIISEQVFCFSNNLTGIKSLFEKP